LIKEKTFSSKKKKKALKKRKCFYFNFLQKKKKTLSRTFKKQKSKEIQGEMVKYFFII
jgi:hypothetical protein